MDICWFCWPLEGNRADSRKFLSQNHDQKSGDHVPPFDLQSTGDQRGVHDRQIFGRDFDLKISENLPGCLPVASKTNKYPRLTP